jgi:hypothetical protein
MSNRLNQDREARLQPQRLNSAIRELEKLGLNIIDKNQTTIVFTWKGHPVRFFPYSGWHCGKTITDGRGLSNLLKQLNK